MKGNRTSNARRAAQHDARIAWLRAHPELLARLPVATEDVEDHHAAALDEAVRRMKHERLFAPTAAPVNTRWWIRLLVSELRGQPVSAKEERWALRGELDG